MRRSSHVAAAETPAPSSLSRLIKRAFADWAGRGKGSVARHVADKSAAGSRVALEALEQRLLLSADPVTSINAQFEQTVTFAGEDDAVTVGLVSTVASANGGVIVDLTYLDTNGDPKTLQFGDATEGITSLVIDTAGGASAAASPAAADARRHLRLGAPRAVRRPSRGSSRTAAPGC